MFIMSFHQNINFGGCNPFMFNIFNPRLNFFLGFAGATAGIPYYSAMPMYGCSIFNPYMPMGYSNPYTTNGMGSFNYQPQPATNPFAATQTQGAIATPLRPSEKNDNSIPTYKIGNYTPANNSVKSKAFLNKVKEIARRLNCDYKDLLGVMQSESSLNPQAVNEKTGATGLIQFMPAIAKSLGTTTAQLKNMSAVAQLDYVEKYLQQTKRQAGFGQMEPLTGGQLYALVFLPARSHREVLTSQGEKYYRANKGLDKNNDGKITKTELDTRIKNFYVNENCFVA